MLLEAVGVRREKAGTCVSASFRYLCPTVKPEFLLLIYPCSYGNISTDGSPRPVPQDGRRLGPHGSHIPQQAGRFVLQRVSGRPKRPPALGTLVHQHISDFFDQLSDLRQGDPIRLVCELYAVFCQETGSKETLDEFYFWGELLISDFDDVDKNLVDARRLFVNLQDLKDMTAGDYTFLDEEQERAIRQFFRNFSADKRTELKARFLSLWDKMGAIYTGFRQRLEHIGLAYEGMVFRRAIERLDVTRPTLGPLCVRRLQRTQPGSRHVCSAS